MRLQYIRSLPRCQAKLNYVNQKTIDNQNEPTLDILCHPLFVLRRSLGQHHRLSELDRKARIVGQLDILGPSSHLARHITHTAGEQGHPSAHARRIAHLFKAFCG